ncbi:MAG: hypothetical protein M3P06_03035 [Acidobacteriota bacterium]|nr:hypothetical protein [Acidobacteriota bacterium]
MDPRTGQVIIIDPGGPVAATLDPHEMVGDLIIPQRTFSATDFNALLAGYVRQGFARLDAKRDGYTAAFLKHVGGQVASTPDPGLPAIDVAALMEQLQLTLDADFLVVRGGEVDPATLKYEQLADYHLLLFLLFTWGSSRRVITDTIAILLRHLPRDEHENVLASLSLPWYGVAQLGHLIEASSASPTAEPSQMSVAHNIISWLTTRSFEQLGRFRELGTIDGGALHPNWALFPVVERRPEGFAPVEAAQLLDKIAAVAEHFAERLDARWRADQDQAAKTTSLAFVWFCVELLHRTLTHPRWDEIRYVRALRAFNRLSWCDECDAHAVKAASLPELHNYLVLSDAFLRLEGSLYRRSVVHKQTQGEGYPLWSLAWRALCRAREMLFATEPILVGAQGLRVVPEETRHLLGLVIADYGASLDAIVRDTIAMEGNAPFVHCIVARPPEQAGSFLRELEWVQGLFVIIEATPASFPAFIAKVQEGRAFFESNARVVAQRAR